MIWKLYEKLVCRRPLVTLAVMTIITLGFAWQARLFQLDASAESLVLENDPDLKLYREVADRFATQDFLVVTYTPPEPLFEPASLNRLESLRDGLRAIEGVDSVLTILDVPLLRNPPVPLSEMVNNIKSLQDPQADKALARQELANSPLYDDMLINLGANTTALQVNLPIDETYQRLLDQRTPLLEDKAQGSLSDQQTEQLSELNEAIRQRLDSIGQARHVLIEQVRRQIDQYDEQAVLHLGGVPMLADDIMTFVKSDLITFGIGIALFMVVTLAWVFRHVRWVMLPLATCSVVVVWMLGIIGTFGWPVTVISSNFISLLLILTLSMLIHLIVRYRELLRRFGAQSQDYLVERTVKSIWLPCLYMAITTGVAFLSLSFSGIRPVIDFGWMMSLGIVVAYLLAFTLFPAVMLVLGKKASLAEKKRGVGLTAWFANLAINKGTWVLTISGLMAALAVWGSSQLVVENSFINYFDEDTEIYQGMKVIDERLGGTTPLDIIVDFPEDQQSVTIKQSQEADGDDGFGDDPFAGESFSGDPFGGGEQEDSAKYWFTQDKIAVVKALHEYLDAQPETGKVLSMATMMAIAESFNDGAPLDDLELALLYSMIPGSFKALVVDPYADVDASQMRITLRMLDSSPELQRQEFLQRIEQEMPGVAGIAPQRIDMTGMMVLYNNMLQSLVKSQVNTLTAVLVGIFIMFMLLFRSWKLAVIGMIPNVIAAGFVLGVMGMLGIPLDMMTITTASIAIGIAVDNTIHYFFRFRREYSPRRGYEETLRRCHATIGKAMFYTSLTIIVGFSIMVLSNFNPTIYFGLLTSLAMFIALLGALTLLPKLILLVRPFK